MERVAPEEEKTGGTGEIAGLHDAINLLMACLGSDEPETRLEARQACVTLGHAAVPWLSAALRSNRTWVRWEAAKALSQIADPSATAPLIAALRDREFAVRWLAAEGLAVIGVPAVAPLLRELIADPKSVWLHEGVHHILHDRARGEWREVLKPVVDALQDPEAEARAPAAAQRALMALGG